MRVEKKVCARCGKTPTIRPILCGVRRCSFFVIVRVFDKYFKTKVYAKDIKDAEQIIEKTITGFEYQIMNIYKANE